MWRSFSLSSTLSLENHHSSHKSVFTQTGKTPPALTTTVFHNEKKSEAMSLRVRGHELGPLGGWDCSNSWLCKSFSGSAGSQSPPKKSFRHWATNGNLLRKPSNLISLGTPITFTKNLGWDSYSRETHWIIAPPLDNISECWLRVDCISSEKNTQLGAMRAWLQILLSKIKIGSPVCKVPDCKLIGFVSSQVHPPLQKNPDGGSCGSGWVQEEWQVQELAAQLSQAQSPAKYRKRSQAESHLMRPFPRIYLLLEPLCISDQGPVMSHDRVIKPSHRCRDITEVPGPPNPVGSQREPSKPELCHSPNRQTHKQIIKGIVCSPPGRQHALKKTWTSSYLASKHQRQSVVGASNFAVANHWCKTVRVLNNKGHSFRAAAVAARWGTRPRCSPGTWSDSLEAAATWIAGPCAPRGHPSAGVEATPRASTKRLGVSLPWGTRRGGRDRNKKGFPPPSFWWIWGREVN